jgi:ATP-binding cassette, subfamily C, bacterial
MAQTPAFIRLLREAPPRDSFWLLVLMLLSRLTEGVGILMLVPILDSLQGQAGVSSFSAGFKDMLAAIGLNGSTGVLLALFVAIVLLRSLLVYVQLTLANRYQYTVVNKLRRRLFGQLLYAEWRWTSQARASDHASVLTAGISRIGVGLNQLINLAANLASMVAYGVTAFILSWKVTLVALLCGGIVHVLLVGHRRRALSLGNDLNAANRAVQAGVQEGLAGIRLTKILRNESRHLARFTDVVQKLRDQQTSFVASTNLAQMFLQIGSAVLLAALLYLGIKYWAVPLSTLLIIVVVFARLIPMFSTVQQCWYHWQHAVPALAELDNVLAESAAAAEPEIDASITPVEMHDEIELDDISVTYAGRTRPALNRVSVRMRARTTIAITGPSGAGKSSLADVLMALLEADRGSLKIDGKTVSGSDRHRWRRSVAYVQQDAFLFNDSVRANLLWANPDIGQAELDAALSSAAADFVHDLPDGLDTVVGDGGVRLSGGERQRIALARALIGRPTLLILDEATSALDPENEALVRRAIGRLHGDLTVVMIGHRIADLDQVDQILRIDKGKVTSEQVGKVAA